MTGDELRSKLPGTRYWAAGIASISGVTSAEIVQITQTDNFLTVDTDSIRADLTGDGVSDLPGLKVTTRAGNYTSWVGNFHFSRYSNRAGLFSSHVDLGAAYYRAHYGLTSDPVENPPPYYFVWEYGGTNDRGNTPKLKRFLASITFSDKLINGGAATNGFLEVRLTSRGRNSNMVRLIRLVFDDAKTTRPEEIVTNGTQREWIAPDYSLERARLAKQLRELKRKLRKAKRQGASRRVRTIRRQIREVKSKLRTLV